MAELLLDTHRAEAQLLSHADFPLDELRRELGCDGTGVRDCPRPDRRRRATSAEDTVLRVGSRSEAMSWCCDCGTGPMCSMRTARPGSPAITSRRWS